MTPETAAEIARLLLETKSVNIDVKNFFELASGMRSPVYVDNRRLIGFPEARAVVVDALVDRARTAEADTVAGTATAGIPWAAWVADRLRLPLCYVRSEAKARGLRRAVEGAVSAGDRVVLIEDTVTTGLSIGRAHEALSDVGAEVVMSLAIFSFDDRAVGKADALTTLNVLLAEAERSDELDDDARHALRDWAAQATFG